MGTRTLVVTAALVLAVMFLGACRTSSVTGSASPNYIHAQSQWRLGANATSADQGGYWLRAASDLTVGLTRDSRATTVTGRRAYTAAIARLRFLTSLPDTDVTAAQRSAAQADVVSLDSFFSSPGLYA